MPSLCEEHFPMEDRLHVARSRLLCTAQEFLSCGSGKFVLLKRGFGTPQEVEDELPLRVSCTCAEDRVEDEVRNPVGRLAGELTHVANVRVSELRHERCHESVFRVARETPCHSTGLRPRPSKSRGRCNPEPSIAVCVPGQVRGEEQLAVRWFQSPHARTMARHAERSKVRRRVRAADRQRHDVVDFQFVANPPQTRHRCPSRRSTACLVRCQIHPLPPRAALFRALRGIRRTAMH